MYYAKTYKFIDMFLNIERMKFLIMNHVKFIFYKPHEFFINDKI